MDACNIESCENPKWSRGWCGKHYQSWRKYGNPEATREYYSTPEESFAARTEWQGDCLVWTGTTNPDGYGQIAYKGRRVVAHRYAYERTHGPIPDGMDIDHICHNKACCNVAHLRLATRKQNMENRNRVNANNTSGYLNVYRDKLTGKWFAQVKHHGNRYRSGSTFDIEDAKLAAIELRDTYFTHHLPLEGQIAAR